MINVYVGLLAQRVIACETFTATVHPGTPRFLVVAGDSLNDGQPLADFAAFERAMAFAEAEARERGCPCFDRTLDETGA